MLAIARINSQHSDISPASPPNLLKPMKAVTQKTILIAFGLVFLISAPATTATAQSVTIKTADPDHNTSGFQARLVKAEGVGEKPTNAAGQESYPTEKGEVAVEILSPDGRQSIIKKNLPYSKTDDPSLRLLMLPDGRYSIIDGDVTFSMGHLLGAPTYTASTLGGSLTPGAPAFIAANASGSTILVIQPSIITQGRDGSGSRISLLTNEGTLKPVFSDSRRQVLGVRVSEDGLWITFVTSVEGIANGEQDQAVLMDRFGNIVAEFSPGSSLTGATLSNDAKYLTAYSRSRVLVYEISSGKRVGSVSTRSPVLGSMFDAEERRVVVLSEGEVQAVDLTRSKIARAQLPAGALSELTAKRLRRTGSALTNDGKEQFPILSDRLIDIQKTGESTYRISGPDKDLSVTTTFRD